MVVVVVVVVILSMTMVVQKTFLVAMMMTVVHTSCTSSSRAFFVLGVHVPSLFPATRTTTTTTTTSASTTNNRAQKNNLVDDDERIVETKHADLRREKRRRTNSDACPAALEGATCDAVATDVKARAACFPKAPYNDWISVHKAVFSVEQHHHQQNEDEEEEEKEDAGTSRRTTNETYVYVPDTPSLRRSRHDEKAKEQFYKKENQNVVDKSETGGGGGVSEKQARRMWHEKQMALDKKKKKIKVNGKVFSRGEVPEKDLFGDTWNGRVDGTTEDESANRRQMFAKRASFKTCAVISSGAALKGKRYGKTIDEHEVVVRLNNAPTIGYENDVGSFTTLRLTNTQYEGVREYEDETVLTKWNGNPMDLMRLGTKKTYAMNPAFRQWAQQLDDTLNNHIVTSGLLMLFLLLQKCERVSAFGFGGKELEKWYYDKRPSGKIPKSAWLNSGRGLVKYDHWNTVSTNAREEALFGAKENRTLAEQPKVKVYGKKDKRIGDMLGIGAGKMANANKKKKENRKSVAAAAADVAKKTLEEKLDGLESAEEVESDMIAGEIEDDGVARRKLLNLVSHVISRERQCMADLADLGVISIYS